MEPMENLRTEKLQPEKTKEINESRLDSKFYFQSLFQEACLRGQLRECEIERIQLEMVELMGKEVERYTNDESSSVPVEKAQEILNSVTYNIGCFLKTTTDMTQKITILKTEKISALFRKGMEAAALSRARADRVQKDLQKHVLKLNNYSYQDTISIGLSKFFHDYDIEFGAHDNPADIDYQLFYPITDLIGVEYIERYLTYLTLENELLECFKAEKINRLLLGFDREAEHMLVNIFELVLINALGCTILGKKITELDITAADILYLNKCFEKLEAEKIEHKLSSALILMEQELSLRSEVSAYARGGLSEIAARIKQNLITGTLDKLFIGFPGEPSEEEFCEDGVPMEDESLRDLIKRLGESLSTPDKINLMKQSVRSMVDFTELMEEAFCEEEYDEVMKSISDNDRAVLLKLIAAEAGPEYDEKYVPQKLWQKKFLETVNNRK